MTHSFYLARAGGLYGLHPLTKLTLALVLVGLAFVLTPPWFSLALFTLVILPLAGWSHIGGPFLRATVTTVLPFALSLGLVQGLFYPGAQDVLVAFGPVAFKTEGVLFAFVTASRILVIVGAALLVVYTTHPADLALALEQAGAPPALAYLAVTAIQLLPEMQARANAIANAQRARGLETEGNVLVRARAFLPLISPLVYSALEGVQERALALEARAFRAKGPKTSWRELRDSTPQRALRVALVLLLGGALVIRLFP